MSQQVKIYMAGLQSGRFEDILICNRDQQQGLYISAQSSAGTSCSLGAMPLIQKALQVSTAGLTFFEHGILEAEVQT